MRPTVLVALWCLGCSAAYQLPPPPTEDSPGQADAYYARKRTGSDDPQRSYALARERMRGLAHYSTASDAVAARGAIAHGAIEQPFDRWTFLGPGNVGGRT